MASDSNGSDEIGRFEAQYRENPDSLVFARLADACRKNGDPERALSILADGIGRHPDYPSAHIVRARCLVDLDRLADAEASLRRVVELDGQNLVAIQGLANLAERRDDPIEAVRWYEQIATLDPMNVEAAAALARLHPTPPPRSSGLEPLPAPSEEWWSSPAFHVEEEDQVMPPEPAEPATLAESEGPAQEESGTAWWFEDPGEDEPADDGDLLTRTMAELYTKQGLLDEAAAIYRELLSDRPEDESLRRALDELQQQLDGARDEPVDEEAEPGVEDAEPELAMPVAEAVEDIEDDDTADEIETAVPSAEVSDAEMIRSGVDRFAMHPVPATSGTGEVLDDWLRRLAE